MAEYHIFDRLAHTRIAKGKLTIPKVTGIVSSKYGDHIVFPNRLYAFVRKISVGSPTNGTSSRTFCPHSGKNCAIDIGTKTIAKLSKSEA